MNIDNKSAQLDEDELMIEETEEDESEVFDEEDEADEYDFNDEEDYFDEEDEPEASSDEEEPEAEAGAEETEETTEETGAATTPEQDDEDSKLRRLNEDLLARLGYHGTYEEALAAYLADTEGQAPEALPGAKEPSAVDYHEVATNALKEINEKFGLSLTDFSSFRNVDRFALLIASGATAEEAYRATQDVAAAPAVSKPSRDHLTKLPQAGAGGSVLTGDDRKALAALRELYPERSLKDLRKTLDRVRRARA